jgi:hypothetical protein
MSGAEHNQDFGTPLIGPKLVGFLVGRPPWYMVQSKLKLKKQEADRLTFVIGECNSHTLFIYLIPP